MRNSYKRKVETQRREAKRRGLLRRKSKKAQHRYTPPSPTHTRLFQANSSGWIIKGSFCLLLSAHPPSIDLEGTANNKKEEKNYRTKKESLSANRRRQPKRREGREHP
jgi:hypothetical protein